MSKSTSPFRVLRTLGILVAVAGALGVLVAGLVVPFAGVVGFGARNLSNTMDKLPAKFKIGDLPETTRILDSNGNLITTLYDQNRVYRPLDQISRKMVKSILGIEDYRFYQHGALDLKGTLRAMVTNASDNGVVQGGSSITQQLVKQTLVNEAKTKKQQEAAIADTYARKLRELRFAIALEQHHSKDWILEKYLNTAYFGDGSYGVQAAAKHYFDVNANQLSWPQAAMLAGLVKNPSGYDPTNFPDAAIARRNTVIERLAQLHVLPQKKADKLANQPLGLHVIQPRNGCLDSDSPFFCDYVVRYLEHDPALGSSPQQRKQLLLSGGLTIKTTLNLKYQRAADSAVRTHVFPLDPAIGAIAEVQPNTGHVLALAQSRPMGSDKKKGQTYINYTIPQELGGSAGFQAGSTFKLFVLSTAIEDHIPLTTTFNSPSPLAVDLGSYRNCPGAPNWGGGPPWVVHNETGVGKFNMITGMQKSINTYFIQLERLTGICKPYALAKKMGVDLTDPNGTGVDRSGAERTPSFTLGTPSVSPLEMAQAYATVAARGKHCDATPVTDITDANGHELKHYAPQCQQVMPPAVADAVNYILKGVQEPGGFGYELGHTELSKNGVTIPSAGKTGTTNGDAAVWFDGYTPQIAAAAMIAGANSVGHPTSLDNTYVGGHFTAFSASGSGFAGPMWAAAMHAIEDTLKPIPFHPIDENAIRGVPTAVPAIAGGMNVEDARRILNNAGFHGVVGPPVNSGYPKGTVAFISPSGLAPSGSVITISPSTGFVPPPPPARKAHHGPPARHAPPPHQFRRPAARGHGKH